MLAVIPIKANAQEQFSHVSSWNTIDIHYKLNDKWSVNNEMNFRRTNFLKD